jgi:hypothetical protein
VEVVLEGDLEVDVISSTGFSLGHMAATVLGSWSLEATGASFCKQRGPQRACCRGQAARKTSDASFGRSQPERGGAKRGRRLAGEGECSPSKGLGWGRAARRHHGDLVQRVLLHLVPPVKEARLVLPPPA